MTKIVSYALIFFPLVHVSAVVERMNGATTSVATPWLSRAGLFVACAGITNQSVGTVGVADAIPCLQGQHTIPANL